MTMTATNNAVRARPFTLIEMIVVMVLMLVLMGLSVGTYRIISRGNQVSNTAREVGSVLRLARHAAVTKREYVACLFPGSELNSLSPNLRYNCYRLAAVKAVGASSFEFIRWLDEDSWHFSPSSVAIMEVDDDPGIFDGTLNSYEPIPEDDNSTLVRDVDLTSLGGGGSVANMRAVVFSPNGRLEGDSQFITIGRANFSSSSTWEIEPRDNLTVNRSTPDQMTIDIHRYTGRISYVEVSNYPLPN